MRGSDHRSGTKPFAGLVGTILFITAGAPSAEEAVTAPSAQVIAVRATKACFSSMIRVNGYIVAREEAMVNLDLPNLRVAEVLAEEGDHVRAGQSLVRLARQTAEGPS